jgi:hypothetical protein
MTPKDTEAFDVSACFAKYRRYPDTTCRKSVRLPCEVCRANHEPLAI